MSETGPFVIICLYGIVAWIEFFVCAVSNWRQIMLNSLGPRNKRVISFPIVFPTR